jgi:hypothetical protein
MKTIKQMAHLISIAFLMISSINYSSTSEIRKLLANRPVSQDVREIDPSIQLIGKEQPFERFGVCHNYAISKILKLENNLPIVGAQDWHQVFHFTENYCYEVDKPKKGDLVLYYTSKDCPIVQHTGLVYNEELVESKWGTNQELLVHRTFSVPENYGDHVKYFRVRCPSDAAADMKIRAEHCGYTKEQCNIFKNNVIYYAEQSNNIAIYGHMKSMMCIPLDISNDKNQNLLMIGAKHNNLQLMDAMVNCNLDINQQDSDGKTALHLAAEKEHFTAVSLLLKQQSCNKKIKDNSGSKALDNCYEFQNLSATHYALKRLAQPTKQAQEDFWNSINT